MGRKFTCFTSVTCAVGMLATAGLKASEGAEADYEWEWSPYVTVRGGWLFGGKAKYEDCRHATGVVDVSGGRKKDLKSAWSGSVEFGGSFCEDFVSAGLELGYFAGNAKHEMSAGERGRYHVAAIAYIMGDGTGDYCKTDGKYKNLFAAVNVTLKKDIGERAFLYGGAGLGMAKSDFGEVAWQYEENNIPGTGGNAVVDEKIDFKSKWRFLTQAFAGLGMHLNENWSLSVGYRLRYLPGDCTGSKKYAHDRVTWDWKVKQNLSHAAEVGLTYQF